MRSFVQLFLTFTLAAAAFAADATGKWKASYETPDGQKRESTLNLKAEGATLTGTIVSAMGEAKIQDGKVDGDNISFSVVRNRDGQDFKLDYKGVVTGDDMKLTVSFGGGDRTFDISAKREK